MGAALGEDGGLAGTGGGADEEAVADGGDAGFLLSGPVGGRGGHLARPPE